MTALTHALFAGLVGERFEASLGPEGPGDILTLTGVKRFASNGPGHEAFSLTFQGSPALVLPSETMLVFHPAIGRQAIFLGPIARDPDKTSYEAIFN